MSNLILNTDSYKHSHYLQYPEGTKYISSYIEPRYSKDFNKVMFFGLQMFLKEYLTKPIVMSDIIEAREFLEWHGEPFNEEGWLHIWNKHGGYLPLEIEALPEGTIHNLRVPQVQVVNTDEKCFWLTSFIETALLRAVW